MILFDVGALIAFERKTERMRALVREATQRHTPILIPAPVLARVWRKPQDQVLLRSLAYSRFSTIVAFDGLLAEAAGTLCARTKTRDIVDACVVIVARQRSALVFTSDPDDLHSLDPAIAIEKV